MLWGLLASFIFRLSFGLAVAMAWTPSRSVTSGFYRVHLWVLMGLNTFAALAVGSQRVGWPWMLILSIVAAVASYIGAVVWMYEARGLGRWILYLVALLDLTAAMGAAGTSAELTSIAAPSWNAAADVITSGMLLGLTMSSMLLGHWYLNTPTMQLAPLKQMIVSLFFVLAVRAILCGGGLAATISAHGIASTGWCALVSLRWLAGLVGIAGLGAMTWQTLKIPNTQSATGILYVAVIFSFLGELSSQLLASQASWAL